MVKEQSYQNTSRLPGFEELNEYFSRKWRLSLLTLSCVTSKIVWNSIQISPLYVIVPMLKNIFILINVSVGIWCDFDRASLLICGNKMPTRCNRGFYYRSYCLLNMFQASLCPSSGAQEYYTVVVACGISCCGFSSSWSGVELRVMRPVCRMLVYWLCFVACMVWVTEDQLKKRVRVI